MRLDQELVRRGLVESRTEAQELIEEGNVFVNAISVTKQTKQVTETDTIEITSRRQFVSRGGEKLQGVLSDMFDNIPSFVSGKTALDVGSSTGGFTDCLLQNGASHIDAVDVGASQLHHTLRNNSKIAVYENTDIRIFSPDKQYDIVVADLSFISLHTVLSSIVSFGNKEAYFFLLIKPQFEVGKGNTKKGIVKDESLVKAILSNYETEALDLGLFDVRILPCHIRGGDGNQEFFLCGVKR